MSLTNTNATASELGMRFPSCPRCGGGVDATLLDEARWYEIASYDGGPTAIRPLTGEQAQVLGADVAVPVAVRASHGEPDPAAPDHDVLTLVPCGCELVGQTGRDYTVAAMSLTWPDLTIEVRLAIPAGMLGISPLPRQVTVRSRWPRDLNGGPLPAQIEAVTARINRLAREVCEQVRTLAGEAGDPT